MRLPNQWRPEGLAYRELKPGLDLPAWFIDDIRSVDPNLYFVWHPYRIMTYEDIMNQYSGSIEDPRFTIGDQGWGFVLTGPNKEPLPEERWHCWRLCETGWAHIFDVKYKIPSYLKQLRDRLHLQKTLTDKGGAKAYIKYLREERDRLDEQDQADETQLFGDVQDENSWLMKKAMSNFERGVTDPTRPQKDVIVSGPWSKRSKITRDITDEEGGLILPDKWKE